MARHGAGTSLAGMIPDAIPIVDIWCVRQHVPDIANALYGSGSDPAAQ